MSRFNNRCEPSELTVFDFDLSCIKRVDGIHCVVYRCVLYPEERIYQYLINIGTDTWIQTLATNDNQAVANAIVNAGIDTPCTVVDTFMPCFTERINGIQVLAYRNLAYPECMVYHYAVKVGANDWVSTLAADNAEALADAGITVS